MILFIDNYDSYVYNLVQYVRHYRQDVRVVRNDAISLETRGETIRIGGMDLSTIDRIILSPGPCGPLEAGICNEIWRELGHLLPILGICLGHQCLGHVFGMTVERAPEVVHGQASLIHHQNSQLLDGIPSPFLAGRYHSLIVTGAVPPTLRATAWLEDGTLMGLEHTTLPLFGLQFHPESILTPVGRDIVRRFLEIDVRAYPEVGNREALGIPARGGPVIRGTVPRERRAG